MGGALVERETNMMAPAIPDPIEATNPIPWMNGWRAHQTNRAPGGPPGRRGPEGRVLKVNHALPSQGSILPGDYGV
jgi:hypothetical protein